MIEQIFCDHPRRVGQTYLEHQRFAASIGGTLLVAGFAALVHAIIPALFVTTAGEAIERLHMMLASRAGAVSRPDNSVSKPV